jgi:5-oxoprolinase (ATP-hydrolysing) subunit C
MTLELIEPGLLTLVQAVPYRGTRHLGMPLAGAADPVAMALANWLAGNGPEMAALETAYAPVTLRTHQDCMIGVQGAATIIEMNGAAMPTSQPVKLARGDVLHIPSPPGGCRSYIAVQGGISADGSLKPTSTYLPAKLGGYNGEAIARGARFGPETAGLTREVNTLPAKYQLRYSMDFLLRIVAAPESDLIDMDSLCDANRTVSRRADRIGLELAGEPLRLLQNTPIDSSAVFPGTIQCPPSGLPFLLGPDAQTTGGYPRIAQVVRADRHLIGQLRPGARVRFQRIEPAEARRLYRSKITLIRQLQPEFRLD